MDSNTISMIINIVFGVLAVVGTGLSYYFSIKNKLLSAANDSIDEKEVDGVAGKKKFDQVCDQLMDLIPAVVKPFITRKMVETIVQHAFDGMERYAEKQVAKEKAQKDDSNTPDNETTTDLKDEVISSGEDHDCKEGCYGEWSAFESTEENKKA